jgi:hypothetical protein
VSTRDRILSIAPDWAGSGTTVWQLRCPECGEDCVERLGGDDASVTVVSDRDEYDSPIGTRGGFVCVKLFCSTGHGFDLIIANHKGLEFIGVKRVGARSYGGDPEGASS